MTRAFANNVYIVMINDQHVTTKGPATLAMIQRHDNKPLKNHWKTIQGIKNKIFGKETVGVEFYPKESQLIDEFNIYWLWIFDEELLPIPNIKLEQ